MAITKDLLDSVTSGSLDPETGLQGQTKTPTSRAVISAEELDIILKNPVPDPSVGAGSLGLDYTKYKNYGGMPVDTDLGEYRATNQSVGEQLAFGAGRLIGTTATKFLSGIGYTLSGIPALMSGDINVMLDNGFSSLITEGEDWLKQDLMPIHHKRKYLEGNVFNQMGTFGFWMDDVIDGAAFMASSLIGAKGLDKIGGGIKAYSKLAQLASKATRAAKLGKIGESSVALSKWAKFADFTTVNAFNSVTEAAFEAKDVKDSVMSELESKVRRGEITQEQASSQASKAAKDTFLWNMVALMPSNMVTNAMIFKKFDNVIPNLSLGSQTIGKTVKPLSSLQKAGVFGEKSIMSVISEGVYEENIQTAVQNYYTDKATAFNNTKFLEDIKGVISEYINNFSTDEGQKSIMLGTIMGFLPGGIGGVKSANAENARTMAQQSAMAQFLENYKTGTHAFYKTKKSVVAPDADIYELDSEGKPVIDQDKVRAGFASFYDSHADLAASLKAVDSGNKIMFDYIRNNNFAKVVAGFHNNEAGAEALDEWVDFQIEAEKEALNAEGFDAGQEFLQDLNSEYKKDGRQLLNRLRQIDNNYAGIIELPDTKEANTFRNILKAEQYGQAVNQMYWSKVVNGLNKDLMTARENRDVKAETAINKQVEEVNSILNDSYSQLKDLIDPKKQQARFKAQVDDIEAVSEGKGAVDDETTEQATSITQDASTPEAHSVVAKDNSTLTTQIFNKEQAAANGYTQDPLNQSVFYKADKENGTLHSITTDNEGNVVKDVYTDQRKMYSSETEAEKQVAVNFVNGTLKNIKVKDVATGIVTEHSIVEAKLADIETVFSRIKSQLKLTSELLKQGEIGQPQLLDEIRAEAVTDKDLSAKYLKRLNNGIDRIDKRARLAEELKDVTLIRDLYGDTKYDGISIANIFSDDSIKYVPAIMGNKSGILENKNGDILFREIAEDGKLGKEFYIGGTTSTTTLGELGIMVIKQMPFDFELVADGRTYNIQNVYYNNLFESATDAIEYTPEGEVEAITLWDPDNKKIRLTNLFLIQNMAYAIELIETVEEQVFNDYIKGEDDFVVYTQGNKNYAVYRKDNSKYSIIDTATTRPITGKLHTDVRNGFLVQLHDAINQLLVSKINEVNTSKKDIKDELRKIAKSIRLATSREAVSLPDKSEAKDPEGREEKKGKSTSALDVENSIETSIVDKAAEIQTAENIKKEQITALAEKQTEEEVSQAVDDVEILSAEETRSGELEVPELGIRESATAASYVWFDRGSQKYTVNNEEFHISAINAGETEIYFTPAIDYDNATFWPAHQELKEELQRGNLSKARIAEILAEVGTNDFNSPVDAIPIKLEEGVYYHATAYDKITMPKSISSIEDPTERVKAYEKHVREEQMITREIRRKILDRILNKSVIAFSSSNKTLGSPNNVGTNQNIGNVLKHIDPNIDLRTVILGIGVRPGQIYKNKEDYIESIKTVGKGNVVLETNYTANGRLGLIKLNPSKLSMEHARIVFNALRQSYEKGKGGFVSNYVGEEVTGDLTRLEVLNLLVYYGEENTKVEPRQFRTKGHLKNKQLWVENAKILHFGENSINIHTSDKNEIKKFLDWATSSKNYAVNRHMLGSTIKGKDKFSIGNFKYDSSVDNYTSFVIKNGVVLTDVDVVPGTKSLFKHPVIGIDLASGGISLDRIKVTEEIVKAYHGVRQEPLSKPAPIEESKAITKVEENKSAVNLNYDKKMSPLTSNAGITTLPSGSILYIPIKENGEINKYKVGRIAVSSSTGKVGFVIDLSLNNFMLGEIKKVLTSIGSFAFDDVNKVAEFNKVVKSFAEHVHFDSPAATTIKPDVVPIIGTKAEPERLEETAKEAQAVIEQESVDKQLDEPGVGDGYLNLPNTGDTNLDDIDGIYKESTGIEGIYTVADIKSEISALNRRLRANRAGEKIQVDVIDRLIKIGQNRHAFAQFMHDGFKLSTLAEEGSMYHEIFHRVSLGYLTETERKSLYNEVRNTTNKEFTDSQAEEQLAEKYREYALLKERQPESEPKLSIGQKISNFIRNLYTFIYTWFTGRTRLDSYDIATVFKAIDKGRFKFARISKKNLENIKGKAYNFEVKGTKLDTVQSSEEYRELIQNLFYLLATSNKLITTDPVTKEVNVNISGYEDVSKLKFGSLYEKVGELRTRYNSVAVNTDSIIEAINKNTLTEEQLKEVKLRYLGANQSGLSKQDTLEKLIQSSALSKRLSELYNEVYDKFEVFKEGIEDFMTGLNMVAVNDDTDSDLLDDETGESVMTDFERYNKTSYMVSSKESTQLSIKILLSMLPESNGRSNLTGLRKFADFSRMWSRTVNDLMGSMDMAEMITRLDSLSADNVPYQYLVKRLRNDVDLSTQFYKAMQRYKHSFINMLAELEEDNTMSYRITTAAIQQASSKYVKDWGSRFAKNKGFFNFTKGAKPKGNIEEFNKLINRYNNLFKDVRTQLSSTGDVIDFNKKITELADMLNTVNIPVEPNIIRLAIAGLREHSESEGLFNLLKNKLNYIFSDSSVIYKVLSGAELVDSKGRKMSMDKLFTQEKGVSYLADIYAKTASNELGDSIYGPNGNRYYTIAQNTYISDLIREIKDNPKEFATKRLSATYSKHSKWLEAILADPKIVDRLELLTQSSFSREDEYDTGREYQGITSMEDLISKIVATESGKLVPPTPADRSFFYYYSGLPALDVVLNNEGKLPKEIIDIFEGYYKDEVNRINQVRKEVDLVLEGKLSSAVLFETYHYKSYKGRNTTGEGIIDGKVLKESGRYTGRGANFTHFSGFTTTMTSEEVRSKIQETMSKRIEDTFKLLDKNGIIRIVQDNGKIVGITNILLDAKHINKYKKLVGDETTALNSLVANFTINMQYSIIETGKMFTGDPAAFKSSEDYVKRLPGYTSTGDNLRTDFPTDYYKGERLVHEPTYNISTLSSHVVRSKVYEPLLEIHKNYYLSKGMAKTETEAIKKAEAKLANLLKVDQTDAQTFISPEMYRALSIRLGEWGNEKEQAYTILQSGNIKDRDEAVELSNLIMHPLKMTYMDIIHKNGHMVPVFDKMSMATLFRPMVKGTQLEEVLDRMEAKGKFKGLTPIDHLKFHTAEKVGIKDRRELFADADEKVLTDLSTLEYYPQNFSRLRRQLITGHDVSKLKVGSQIKKIGLSNIFPEDVYMVEGEEMFGEELRKEINDILSELSDRGINKLYDELGIDKNTVKFTSAEILIKKLRNEAKKAQLPDYIVEAFKLDANGKFYVSIDSFVGNRKWMQSRIISLIKKASIDLMLPGNAFVQMSDIGLRNAEFSDELRIMDEDGYIEVKVSIGLFKTVIPNFDNLTHTERVNYLTRNEEYLSLGYRVPTQGQNSIYLMKIVDFLPESNGDTIILPKEGTALGGFDFDIDKLYVIRYNYENGNKVKYNNALGLKGNTTSAIENRLLDDYFSVLKNENHFIRRTTPLGYTADIMKRLAGNIRKWKGIKEDVTDALAMVSPAYQTDVKERYRFGKTGLGPFALSNTHHVLGQMVKLGMKQYIGIGYKNEESTTDLSRILGEDGIDITEWFSGLIDAHVDIAADPYVYYLNVNDYTRDLVTLLLRAGLGGERVFKFTAQPVLEDVAKLMTNKNNRLGVRTANPVETVKEEYRSNMLSLASKEFVPKTFSPTMLSDILSEGKLENLLTEGFKKKDVNYYNNQLLILDAFEYLNSPAAYLKEAILASRVDTKKFGTSAVEVLSYKNRVMKSYNDMYSGVGVLNFDKLMEDTYLNALTKNSVDVIGQVLSNIVIEGTTSFTKFVDKVLKTTGNLYTLDERMLPTLVENIYSLVYSDFFRQAGLTKELANSMLYGENSVPKLVHDIKAGTRFSHLKDNTFIRAMDPVYSEGEPDFISFSKPDNKWYRDDLNRAWKDMFAGTVEDRELAIKLFQYSFLTTGFKGAINSYHELVPLELVKYIGLDNHIKTVLRSATSDDTLFDSVLDNLFVNNWNNRNLVPLLKAIDSNDTITYEGSILAVKVDQSRFERGANIKGQAVFAPYIKVGKKLQTLYKYIGYLKDTNEAVYTPVSKKGYKKSGFSINESSYNGTLFDNNQYSIPTKVAKFTSAEGFTELLSISPNTARQFPGFIPVADINVVELKEDIENITSSLIAEDYRNATSSTISKEELEQRIKECK